MKRYYVVAVVKNEGAEPEFSYTAPDNGRRYLTPHGAVEHIREIVANGFFVIVPIEDAPEGVPALFVIPVARVYQWHVVEAPDAEN